MRNNGNATVDLVNLTGNDIRILIHEGEKVIKKAAWQAKCRVDRRQVDEIDGIPITVNTKEIPVGVPNEKDGTIYIVSKVVGEKLKEMGRTDDILVPDEIVRSGSVILGCKSLTKA